MKHLKRLFLTGLLSGAAFAAAADTYKIDPSHTFPTFEVRHLGLAVFRGRFDKTSGTITMDAAKKTGSADITVQMDSISTGVKKLDEHLSTADFFDVKQYPTMTFKSGRFKFGTDGKLSAVEGNLTLHGVTQPVTLKVTALDCKEHPMSKKMACGGNLEGALKRSDFGISFGVPNVSDEVTLRIGVEAAKAD